MTRGGQSAGGTAITDCRRNGLPERQADTQTGGKRVARRGCVDGFDRETWNVLEPTVGSTDNGSLIAKRDNGVARAQRVQPQSRVFRIIEARDPDAGDGGRLGLVRAGHVDGE